MVSLKTNLSELEGAVLGALRLHAPCTPYRVRRVFLESPSPYWSGSAGAIYPLMVRLERQGLVRSRADASGTRRSGRLYSLSAAGRRALRAWLRPPWPAQVTGVPADPLRTRVSFFAVLTPAERRAFVDEALAALAPAIREHQEDRPRNRYATEPFEAMVASGALAMLRARRAWLVALARELRRPPRRRA